MKKILSLFLLLLLLSPITAHAEIRQSENGTVTSRESAFTYIKPIESVPTEANDKNAGKPEKIFTVYVKTARFYNRTHSNYRELEQLIFTSHTQKIDLLFDKDCPPRIEYTKNGALKTLRLKKVYFTNQYFMSFKIKRTDLNDLYDADKVEIIFPHIINGSNIGYVKDKKGNKKPVYVKQELDGDSVVEELRYTVPRNIVNEWQKVLSADLATGTIKNTLS